MHAQPSRNGGASLSEAAEAAGTPSPGSAPNPELGLPTPQRYWAMLVIALALTLAVLDSAIANVALPTIARNLHASAAGSIWVINAYQLAITISLLPLASLGDRIGYRRIYLAGLILFTLASFGCALSNSLPTLALARVAQGFGAAGVMSVNTALVRMIYPPTQLGRGVAINAMVVAVSSAVGPTVASGVLAVASWPWLFAINVPIGIAAIVGAIKALPMNRGHDSPYDLLSAVMNAFVFGLLIFAVDGLGQGEHLLYIAAEVFGAVVIGYFFVRRQLSRPAPLLPVDLLSIPIFALSIGTSVCSFCAQMLAFVSLPFMLQDTLGLTQVETGLLMTPWPAIIIIAAPVSGVLADKVSSGWLGGIGLAAMTAGLLLLATLGAHPDAVQIAWRMALCGAGFGIFQSPNNRTMLSAA
ncbi:MAG TPA: MFS transporter, partial [Paraburkholderia sp.]|uniref:MFS transporter n=1 Tax=Paraburkholderia sp. TaxID=1926495 RepID=UPI002ED67B4D